MLEYSSQSRNSLDLFFRFRNDIDIYTEDNVADKEFYRALFKRINRSGIKLNDVIPLGSKSSVLAKYKEYITSKKDRRKLFLIDGDLELIIGENPAQDQHLFIHNAYCIENLIINEHAVVELIYYSIGSMAKEEIRSKLNFVDWLSTIAPSLIKMFLKLGLLRQLKGQPIVKHASDFLSSTADGVELDELKVSKYCQLIEENILEKLTQVCESPDEKYNELLSKLNEVWPIDSESLLKIVSGKNYLLPLLQFKIRSIIGGKTLFPTRSIKLFLVSNCTLERFEDLERFITPN